MVWGTDWMVLVRGFPWDWAQLAAEVGLVCKPSSVPCVVLALGSCRQLEPGTAEVPQASLPRCGPLCLLPGSGSQEPDFSHIPKCAAQGER